MKKPLVFRLKSPYTYSMENKDKNNGNDNNKSATPVRTRISYRSIVRRRRGSAWRKALVNGTNV